MHDILDEIFVVFLYIKTTCYWKQHYYKYNKIKWVKYRFWVLFKVDILKCMLNFSYSLFQIQQNKQQISSLKRKHSDSIEDLRPTTENNTRFNSRWTNEELLIAVQGVRKYGKDFKSIAEMIGNKTEHHVRTFFVNYRKR